MLVLDELDDDALSDGGEDDLTPEQQGTSRHCVFMDHFRQLFYHSSNE